MESPFHPMAGTYASLSDFRSDDQVFFSDGISYSDDEVAAIWAQCHQEYQQEYPPKVQEFQQSHQQQDPEKGTKKDANGCPGRAPSYKYPAHQYPAHQPAAQCSQCPNSFSRPADLARHVQAMHAPSGSGAGAWRCDHRNCDRRENPIPRKDHAREHLRVYHKEDLMRRGSRSDDLAWWQSRIINGNHWRCGHCLNKVRVKTDAWQCPTCQLDIEPERLDWRLHPVNTSDPVSSPAVLETM